MLSLYFKEFHEHFGTRTDDLRFRPPDPWLTTDSSSSASSTPTDDGPFLQCALCHDRYNKPKVLPCLHTFCQGCLLKKTPKDSLTLTCPICRYQSILPRKGVVGLQDNIMVSNIVSLFDDTHPTGRHKNHCDKTLMKQNSITELPPIEESAVEQKIHLKSLLSKATSQIPILKEDIQNIAIVVNQLNQNHLHAKCEVLESVKDLENSLRDKKMELVDELERIRKGKHDVLQKQKHVLEMCLSNLEDHCNYTNDVLVNGSDEELCLLYQDMAEKLEDFVTIGLQKIPKQNDFISYDNTSAKEVKNKLKHVDGIKTSNVSCHESCLEAHQSTDCEISTDLYWSLTVRDTNGLPVIVEKEFREIILTTPELEQVEPRIIENESGSCTIQWTTTIKGTYCLSAKIHGQHVTGSPQFVTCKETKIIEVSEAKKLTAVIEDTYDVCPKFHESSISDCSQFDADKAEIIEEYETEGAHPEPSITECPHFEDDKEVDIIEDYEEKDVENSSCEAFCGQIDDDLLMTIGRRGRCKGEFTNIQGVCCTDDNKIIVADSNNQCVQVFDDSGKCLLKFGGRGRAPGQMQRPTGVAVSASGNYLVADYENRWVNVFKPDGKFLKKFGSGKLLGPRGLTVTRDGKVVVVDNKASCVYIMQENGKVTGKIGSPGCGKGRFSGPHYVALDSCNRLVISDFHNHSVHVFLLDGSHVITFGSNGEGNGQFNAPTGIAVDSQDNIIVADWGNNRIQVFDSNGSFLSYVNTTGDPVFGPQDLAMTPDGNIIVADSGNHCLKIYKYLQ